jgi:hypothetical protein
MVPAHVMIAAQRHDGLVLGAYDDDSASRLYKINWKNIRYEEEISGSKSLDWSKFAWFGLK